MKLIFDDWQKKFLETKGDKILCTGRQVGKSEVCGADAGEYAINHPKSKPIVMIAPTERQARGLFNKTLDYLSENYPNKIAKGKKRPTNERITLITGVDIYCLPVGLNGLGIRFLTIGRLYVDEASRIPEEVWAAITPALLTTGGDTIILSTPAGATGEFYNCWINKDEAYNSFTRFSISSEEVMQNRPINQYWTKEVREKAIQKLEQAKARMSKREYAQEFLGKFDDALNRVFSDALIKECCILKRIEVIRNNFKHYLGVDIARMGDDEETFEIIGKDDKGFLEHEDSIIKNKILTTETEREIIRLNELWNFREIDLDAGAGTLGVSVLDHLLEVDNLKKKVIPINNRARSLDKDENSKSKLLKEDLYNNLLALMEQGKIKLLNDDEVIASLQSVQYEYVIKEGESTKMRIFGNYTHIAEGLIRAAWGASADKHLNIWCKY